MSENLVEVARRKIISVGDSQYVGIPDHLKREGSEVGDEVVFLREPNSTDTVIRIEKASKSNGTKKGA